MVKQKVRILQIAVYFAIDFSFLVLMFLRDNHRNVFWKYSVTYQCRKLLLGIIS